MKPTYEELERERDAFFRALTLKSLELAEFSRCVEDLKFEVSKLKGERVKNYKKLSRIRKERNELARLMKPLKEDLREACQLLGVNPKYPEDKPSAFRDYWMQRLQTFNKNHNQKWN